MIALGPRIRLDEFGRKEFRLFEDIETHTLREPIAGITAGRFTYPTSLIGSDGPSALDYNPADGSMKTKYGCPVSGIRANPNLRGKVMGISRSAYNMIVDKLGARYGRHFQPRYVAGADAFKTQTRLVGRDRIPVSQMSAALYINEESEVIDEGTIYDTNKNKRLRSRYKSGLKVAERIGGQVGKNLGNFYRNIKRKLEDRYGAVKTSVHEKFHSGGENSGLHDEIIEASPSPCMIIGMIEGFACAGAKETIGDKPIGQYEYFMKRTYRALKEMGYRGVLGFIRDYIDGRVSGRKYALAYARARC